MNFFSSITIIILIILLIRITLRGYRLKDQNPHSNSWVQQLPEWYSITYLLSLVSMQGCEHWKARPNMLWGDHWKQAHCASVSQSFKSLPRKDRRLLDSAWWSLHHFTLFMIAAKSMGRRHDGRWDAEKSSQLPFSFLVCLPQHTAQCTAIAHSHTPYAYAIAEAEYTLILTMLPDWAAVLEPIVDRHWRHQPITALVVNKFLAFQFKVVTSFVRTRMFFVFEKVFFG
jgi:hypothetical protein